MADHITNNLEQEISSEHDSEEFDLHRYLGDQHDDADDTITLNIPETCNYHDINDIKIDPAIYNRSLCQFKSIHLNIQSLSAKFDELKLLCRSFRKIQI